jgi:hypothetical protein
MWMDGQTEGPEDDAFSNVANVHKKWTKGPQEDNIPNKQTNSFLVISSYVS